MPGYIAFYLFILPINGLHPLFFTPRIYIIPFLAGLMNSIFFKKKKYTYLLIPGISCACLIYVYIMKWPNIANYIFVTSHTYHFVGQQEKIKALLSAIFKYVFRLHNNPTPLTDSNWQAATSPKSWVTIISFWSNRNTSRKVPHWPTTLTMSLSNRPLASSANSDLFSTRFFPSRPDMDSETIQDCLFQ